MSWCLAWITGTAQSPAEAVPAPCPSVAGLGLGPLPSYGHEQKILKWDSSILLLLLAQAGATAQPWAHRIPHHCHPAGLCLGSPGAGSWAPTAASASHLKEVHKLLVILQQNTESCHRQKPRKYVLKSTCVFFKTNIYAAGRGKEQSLPPDYLQLSFPTCRDEALTLLSLCRENTAFAVTKLCLYKLQRMPSWMSDRGKTSAKNIFFLFCRDLIYLRCIPDLQKVFPSHTLSIAILLTREHFVRALNCVT